MKENLSCIKGPLSAFHIEADRSPSGLTVRVGGIIAITDYSEERVSLKGHSGRLTVLGERLRMTVYEDKTVEILGRVEAMEMKYGKN